MQQINQTKQNVTTTTPPQTQTNHCAQACPQQMQQINQTKQNATTTPPQTQTDIVRKHARNKYNKQNKMLHQQKNRYSPRLCRLVVARGICAHKENQNCPRINNQNCLRTFKLYRLVVARFQYQNAQEIEPKNSKSKIEPATKLADDLQVQHPTHDKVGLTDSKSNIQPTIKLG